MNLGGELQLELMRNNYNYIHRRREREDLVEVLESNARKVKAVFTLDQKRSAMAKIIHVWSLWTLRDLPTPPMALAPNFF